MFTGIKRVLIKNRIVYKMWVEYTDIKDCIKNRKYVSDKNIKKYKNTKRGQRCFVIGNGPSLSIQDLEKLQNEDTFAVNRIYKIFENTDWRPTFYCSQDEKVLQEIKGDIHTIMNNCQGVFLSSSIVEQGKAILNDEKLNYFYLNLRSFYPDMPKFSKDVSKCVYEGYTVAYACIQLAVYMGYSEIYIIGTDHNYSVNLKQDGSLEENSNVSNYMKGLEGKVCFYPQLEKSTLAFRKSREICEKKGIVIKNATRGGKLEEFERIDFDTIFD